MSSNELLMVLGGTAVGAYVYYHYMSSKKDKATRNVGTLVILSAGVAFAVYNYTPASAGAAAAAGIVVGPATDAASAVVDMLPTM